ncbi:hypothetical protein G6F24_018223 [Rhizopus arrhizus]|nr:hypothetical protein G6F24_018223 [Rhizopus arrhizus]
MVSGAIVAAFVAVPLAVLFAVLLAPFGAAITKSAPWIFLAAAVLIAYFSAGRWAAVALLVPFVVVIIALQSLTAKPVHGDLADGPREDAARQGAHVLAGA